MGGGVLCGELKVRWGKRMGSLLLLGAAYGALKKRLMVRNLGKVQSLRRVSTS